MYKQGFTLVELLVVIIIIGILASIGIPQYTSCIEKAKGAEARIGLHYVQTSEKIYFAEKEYYTPNLSNLDMNLEPAYWSFVISVPTSSRYLITAARSGGVCSSQTLTVDQSGTMSGTWIYK